MNATEKLRMLLDERGIGHVDADDGHTQHTWWSDGDHEISACDNGRRLAVYNLTPEQAIAATVVAGTCTMEPDGYYGEQYGIYKCSNCGELWQFGCDSPKEHGWTCCPKCQARIKEDGE